MNPCAAVGMPVGKALDGVGDRTSNRGDRHKAVVPTHIAGGEWILADIVCKRLGLGFITDFLISNSLKKQLACSRHGSLRAQGRGLGDACPQV